MKKYTIKYSVFLKCIFSYFPKKLLSISSLAVVTSLDRLAMAILSLVKDQTKLKKISYWKYLVSARCLTFIWPRFCALRLLTICAVHCRQCTQSATSLEGEEKTIRQFCHLHRNDASNLCEKWVCAYMDFLYSALSYNLPILESRTQSHWCSLFCQVYPDMNIMFFLETKELLTLIFKKLPSHLPKKTEEEKVILLWTFQQLCKLCSSFCWLPAQPSHC